MLSINILIIYQWILKLNTKKESIYHLTNLTIALARYTLILSLFYFSFAINQYAAPYNLTPLYIVVTLVF